MGRFTGQREHLHRRGGPHRIHDFWRVDRLVLDRRASRLGQAVEHCQTEVAVVALPALSDAGVPKLADISRAGTPTLLK